MKNLKINLVRVMMLGGLAFIASSFSFTNYTRHVKEVTMNSDKEKDSQFLVHAAEINLEEIKLAQLAQSKSLTVDVKELGKMMEDAHAKSMKELVALAKKKSVTIPMMSTYSAKESYRNLDGKSGATFDKAYCKLMVDGHKEAIDLFEKAAAGSEDKDVKKWAEDTLPTLRKHLQNSTTCLEKCEKMM